MGSFGPVSALANLSNNLNQTLASGERVLSLLEEEPQVEDISGRPAAAFEGASAERVDFSYGGEEILKDYCLEIPRGKILGIHGQSGCGKSTLLKLLMRFWDVQGGAVKISGRDIRQVKHRRSPEHGGFHDPGNPSVPPIPLPTISLWQNRGRPGRKSGRPRKRPRSMSL